MKICLVVDDSDVIRKVARALIEPLGYIVAEATDANQALDHCEDEQPALIMLDWSLPDTDILDLIRAQRQLPSEHHVPIILAITENDPQFLNRAFKAGIDGYIFKPFDRETLHTKIAEVTGQTVASTEAY